MEIFVLKFSTLLYFCSIKIATHGRCRFSWLLLIFWHFEIKNLHQKKSQNYAAPFKQKNLEQKLNNESVTRLFIIEVNLYIFTYCPCSLNYINLRFVFKFNQISGTTCSFLQKFSLSRFSFYRSLRLANFLKCKIPFPLDFILI